MRTKQIPWSRMAGSLIIFWVFHFICRTFSVKVRNDYRERIKQKTGKAYVYALLHAHQIQATALSEAGTGAMVSRSRDGDILVPLLQGAGCVPIRGSSGGKGKGGATALTQLIRHVRDGHPAVIAVDGPRGPRGIAQKGCAFLAAKTGVPIVPASFHCRKRKILTKTWDRLQLPLPFSQLECIFGDPIYVAEDADLDAIARQVSLSLAELEAQLDPAESEHNLALQNQTRPSAQKRAA